MRDSFVRRASFVAIATIVVIAGPRVLHAAAQGTPKPATAKRAAAAPAKPPAPPARLEVTVLDEAGRPVPGALVVAVASIGGYTGMGQPNPDRRRSALTSAEGLARLEAMPRPPWDVSVRARGFSAWSDVRFGKPTLTVRLQKGGTITGVVLDGTTKQPVAGARVSIESWSPLPSDWEERAVENRATTDAKGLFRLDGVGRGPQSVVARAQGYGAGRREARPGSRVELFLFAGATLSGTVRDERGRPVRGAGVRLQGDGWMRAGPAETTDEKGAFVMAGVERGEYLVVAREGARAPALDTVVVPQHGEVAVDLSLGAGGFVRGRVVDTEGKPLAGARARVISYEARGLPSFVADALSGESAADGTFAVGPVPEGKLVVSVSLPRYQPQRLTADVTAGQAADLRDVVLEAGLSIRGRVRDAEGNPVFGALTSAQREGPSTDDMSGDARGNQVETEADGGFVLAGLRAGSYSISASADGFARASKRGDAGGEPVELVLQRGGSISGKVVDTTGAPVDGATVMANAADLRPGAGAFLAASTGGAAGEGRFVIPYAAEGTYGLAIRATGYGESNLASVKVVPGRDTDIGVVTIGAGGTVVGTIVDSNGDAVPGATVRVERDTNVHTGALSAETGLDGAFEVRGVPPGKVIVDASHPAYVGTRVRGVEVDLAQEPSPLRIVMTRGGRIEGRARHRDGSPFVGGRVRISVRGGASIFRLEMAPTGADGSFTLEHVPAGAVTVSLMTFVSSHPSGGGGPGVTMLAGVTSREVEVHEGETATVEIVTREVVIGGRVTRGGRGVPGVRVAVMTADSGMMMSIMAPGAQPANAPQQGPPPLSAATREDGTYELLAFGPGRGHVTLTSESPRQSHPGREVEIPDAERFELDLELGEATVSGIVVDRESGAPVPEAIVGLRAPGPDGQPKGGGNVAPDGRFTVGADAGDYVLEANAPGRKRATLPVTLTDAGVSDLRVEMEQGLEITGRLVDVAGRPVAGVSVYAIDPGQPRQPASYANTLPDGGFRLDGLESKGYVVTSGSEMNGFAIRAGVTPGGDPLTLRLKPGGRIVVRVLGPDGQPAKSVYPRVQTWEGVRVYLSGTQTRPTDTPGEYEMSAPEGSIGVEVGGDKRYGTATATVRAGETTRVEMRLRELPQK